MKHVLVALLKAYRAVISPLYGQVCRYHPTCSAYALGAVETHGSAPGLLAGRPPARALPPLGGRWLRPRPRRTPRPPAIVAGDATRGA